MKNERLILFSLAVVQFTHILDFMIIMPLGSKFMKVFEVSSQQFSLIVSAYAIAAFSMGLIGATMIDRFDRKHALLVAYLGFLLGTTACALAPTYPILLAARFLTGSFGGLLGTLSLSIIGDVIPYKRRASAMGIVMMAFSAASVLGVPAGIYLAAEFSWRAPFLSIAAIAVVLWGLIFFSFPNIRLHLEREQERLKPLQTLGLIFRDANQTRALLFTVVLMLGHFTIIPFIAPYMELNIGFSDYQVSYIYLVGGLLTVFLLPLFGKLADRYGNFRVFTGASIAALLSIFAITNLPPVPVALALCATSSFFVVASGRNVPGLTMVTSVVRPENRGSFMSVRTSTQQLGMGLASLLAGVIITEQPDGSLLHYEYAGYLAMGASLIAIVAARGLKPVDEEEDKAPVQPAVSDNTRQMSLKE